MNTEGLVCSHTFEPCMNASTVIVIMLSQQEECYLADSRMTEE